MSSNVTMIIVMIIIMKLTIVMNDNDNVIMKVMKWNNDIN